MIFKIKHEKAGCHIHCALFAAKAKNWTYEKCGDFTVREEEFEDLQRVMAGVLFEREGPGLGCPGGALEMTPLTPDERAAAVEALKYIRAGFFRTSDERTICHGDLSKMVEAAERAIALLSGPPAFARPALTSPVETAALALVARMEPIYDYAAYDLGWKREFLALKAALAATEGGDAPESNVRPTPETSPGAGAAPLAPGEDAELEEIAEEIDRLALVIESAVRNADPPHCGAVVAALKINRCAIAKAKGAAKPLLPPKIEQARAEEREAIARWHEAEASEAENDERAIDAGLHYRAAAAIRQRGAAK